MKQFIYKTNQYLLERYPNIWNTKLVWMLAISFIIHLVFFFLGIFSLSNPKSLHDYGVKYSFFSNGAVYLSVIISILLVVIWLSQMFKNNAFKSFYPTSRWGLFKQFLLYFIIVFASTSFYLSYVLGIKTYIESTYDDARFKKEIAIANKAAVFFSQGYNTYSPINLRYPDPFGKLYCETRSSFIDYEKPYFSQFEFEYQFYSLKRKERKASERYEQDEAFKGYVFRKAQDSIDIYFFRDSVVDVSEYLKSAQQSYFNYSETFFKTKDKTFGNYYESGESDLADYDYYDELEAENYNSYRNLDYSKEAIASSKYVHELLKRNNPEEIKTILSNFLEVANAYKLDHNLDVDTWFKLVYNPTDFHVNTFLGDGPHSYLEAATTSKELTESELFVSKNTSKKYIKTTDLKYAFENIEDIKTSDLFTAPIHVLLWLAFGLASVIFMFRVSNLRTLLFSIITTGVLCVFTSLLAVLGDYILAFNGDNVTYFIAYFTLILGGIILAIPLFFHNKIRKTVVGICMNMSIGGFVLYILLIIAIISMHQSDYCTEQYGYSYNNNDHCFVLISALELNLSYLLLALGFVFLYFYSGIIKRWRALPEG